MVLISSKKESSPVKELPSLDFSFKWCSMQSYTCIFLHCPICSWNHHLYCKFHWEQTDLSIWHQSLHVQVTTFQLFYLFCIFWQNLNSNQIPIVFVCTVLDYLLFRTFSSWQNSREFKINAILQPTPVYWHRTHLYFLQKILLISKLSKLLPICGGWPCDFTAVTVSEMGIVRTSFLFHRELPSVLTCTFYPNKTHILMFQLLSRLVFTQ